MASNTELNYTHPELVNLATKLSKEVNERIAELVVSEYEEDRQSRKDWEDQQAVWLDIYHQQHKTQPPFEGGSSESLPIIAEACSQLHARAFNAMLSNEKIIRVIPQHAADSQSSARAMRLTAHMRHTVFEKIDDYLQLKDALLLGVALRGCMFTKTYYDPIKERIEVKNIRPTDLVLPYMTGYSTVEEAPRKTEIIRMPIHVAAKMYKTGFFMHMPETQETQPLTAVDEQADYIGLTPSISRNQCVILEQHRYIDLKNNGNYAPVIAWVDLTSRKLLRLSIRWETDETGIPTRNAEPTEYYTQWNMIPNPDSIYGMGYGQLLGALNIASNKLLRVIIDGGILSTVGGMSGFIDRRLTSVKGDVDLELGKFVSVPSVDDINNKIWSPKFAGPHPVLLELMKHITQRGDRFGMVTDLITGQAEKVMQPTAVMALLDQSQIGYSAIHYRLMKAWERELRKIYILNSKFMPPMEYVRVLDADEQLMPVLAADYSDDYQVKVTIEKITDAKQRLTASEIEFQTLMSMPWVQADIVTQYNLAKRRLEAVGVDPISDVLPPLEHVMQVWQAMMQAQAADSDAAVKREVSQERNKAAIIRDIIKVTSNEEIEKIKAENARKTSSNSKK